MRRLISIFVVVVTLCSLMGTAAFASGERYERLESCVKQIEEMTDFKPEIVLVLGTGLGDFVDTLLRIGEEQNIPVHSGVYLQVTGPQFETPAEIRMYRALGADTIAMSLADEVLAASHMNMKVCAINCISNMAAGMEEEGFSVESIEGSMNGLSQNFQVLMNGLLDTLVQNPDA